MIGATDTAIASVDCYPEIASALRSSVASGVWFDALIGAEPQSLPETELQGFVAQFQTIKRFQETCLEIFVESAAAHGHWLAELLFRDVPPDRRSAFHRELPRPLLTTPRFFRTDQPGPGSIAEIQCPGSGWGECSLLTNYYADNGHLPQSARRDVEVRFNRALRQIVSDPVVHHLTDNASSLVSNVYFINATRNARGGPRYFGFDAGVRAQDCNFIRTHLFEGLLAENFWRTRLIKAAAGKVFYDYPPLCIFEQKALLALPFHPETRSRFRDDIRGLIPRTVIVTPEGFETAPGEFRSLDEISRLPRTSRKFFLKYGGADPSRNWGSRAVHYAGDYSGGRLAALLGEISVESQRQSGCWIAQDAVFARQTVSFISPQGGRRQIEAYPKLSAFYGPLGLIGIGSMHRRVRKVHGQSDTIMSVIDLGTLRQD